MPPDVDDAGGCLVGSGSILQQVCGPRPAREQLGIAAEVTRRRRSSSSATRRSGQYWTASTRTRPRRCRTSARCSDPTVAIVVATDWSDIPDLARRGSRTRTSCWAPTASAGATPASLRALRDRSAAHRGRCPRRAGPLRQQRRPPGGEVDPCPGRRSRDVRPADPLTRPTDAPTAGSATTAGLPEHVPQSASHGTAREVFATTLRLGLTSFGGPIAHLGYLRTELVDRLSTTRCSPTSPPLPDAAGPPAPAGRSRSVACAPAGPGCVAAMLRFTLPGR